MNILLQAETFIPSFLSDETLVNKLSTNKRIAVLIGFILLFILIVYLTYRAVHEQLEFMAIIEIDTDKLNADIDYYENGWFGISIYYKGKVIKKIER